MKNKVVLITGSTDGIGKETALQLAKLGATVIVHGRNTERCKATRDGIRQAADNPNVDFVMADFSSQQQVRRMAAEIQARYDQLHVLINNAALISPKRQLTEDGLEMTLAVNHLAPFLLTNLLLDRLNTSAPARIVNVSSRGHFEGKIDFNDLQSERRYDGFGVYKNSKLWNVLFTLELADRLKGTSVTANCLHPGMVKTKLLKTGAEWADGLGSSCAKGAVLSVYLASSPDIDNMTGQYFEYTIRPCPYRPSPKAVDVKLRRKLWDISAQLTGLTGTEPDSAIAASLVFD